MMRAWIRWHLLRHLDDLRDGTRARALLHLGLSLLGDPAESRLGQQEAEIERLRGLLEAEIRERDHGLIRELSYKGDVEYLRAELARDRDEARAELARLREQTTPRTYKAGDHQPEYVLWWSKRDQEWARLCGDLLDPEDLWLPMPPLPSEDEGQ